MKLRARAKLVLATALGIGSLSVPVAIADPGNFPGRTAAQFQIGNDVSWPQCPVDSPYANPMPPSTTAFVIIGLTNGKPFRTNSCFVEQVAWTRARYKPMQFYTMSGYPTSTQISQYGSSGPFPSSTYIDRLRNTGYAAAKFDIDMMRRVGVAPNRIWIDIEQLSRQPWPLASSNPYAAANNRAVIEGMLYAYRVYRIYSGFYANANDWTTIMANWQRTDIPFWGTVGTRGQAAALDRCRSRGLNGGLHYLVQWWDSVPRDWDVTCPGYKIT